MFLDYIRKLLPSVPATSTKLGKHTVEYTASSTTAVAVVEHKPEPPPELLRTLSNEQLLRLKKRCEQPIAKIIKEMAKRKDTIVHETADGPLVHWKNGSSVLGVCHMDYVEVPHKWKVDFHSGKVFTPRLDDRLGLFILLDLLPSFDIHLDLLFTDNEEKGRSTAKHLELKEHQYNWVVEFDRRGDGTVLYQYDHCEPWKKLLKNSGFDVQFGSVSDISYLDLGVCGMNVGVGYHHEHSKECYMQFSELKRNINLFLRFYEQQQATKHVFDKACIPSYSGRYGGGRYPGRSTTTASEDYYRGGGSYYGSAGTRGSATYSMGKAALTITYGRPCHGCDVWGVVKDTTLCEACLLDDRKRDAEKAKLLQEDFPYLAENLDIMAVKVLEYQAARDARLAKNGEIARPTAGGGKIPGASGRIPLPWSDLKIGDEVHNFGGEWVVKHPGAGVYRPVTIPKKQRSVAVAFLHTALYHHKGMVRYLPYSVEHDRTRQDSETGLVSGVENMNWELIPIDDKVVYRRVHSSRFEVMLGGKWYNVFWTKKARGQALNYLRNVTKEKKSGPQADTQVLKLDDLAAEKAKQEQAEAEAKLDKEIEAAAGVVQAEEYVSAEEHRSAIDEAAEAALAFLPEDSHREVRIEGFAAHEGGVHRPIPADVRDVDDEFPTVATIHFTNDFGESSKLPVRVASAEKKGCIVTDLVEGLRESGCTSVWVEWHAVKEKESSAHVDVH